MVTQLNVTGPAGIDENSWRLRTVQLVTFVRCKVKRVMPGREVKGLCVSQIGLGEKATPYRRNVLLSTHRLRRQDCRPAVALTLHAC